MRHVMITALALALVACGLDPLDDDASGRAYDSLLPDGGTLGDASPDAGALAPGCVCRPGSGFCIGEFEERCAADCSGYVERVCAIGCANGACVPECPEGARRCGTDGVEACVSGRWSLVSPCRIHCDPATLACPSSCRPGASTCEGDVQYVCDASGTSETARYCDLGCWNTACRPPECEVPSGLCVGNDFYECFRGAWNWRYACLECLPGKVGYEACVRE